MKLIVFSVLAACVVGMSQPRINFQAEWKDWKVLHDKSYAVKEEYKRQMIWEENRHIVMKHNYEYGLGKHTYRLGMNRFADMTSQEFKALYLGEKLPSDPTFECKKSTYTPMFTPVDIDWTKKGYVTAVKNQGELGSSCPFSTTGSVEGQLFNATGRLVPLSEQNLVDCSDVLLCFNYGYIHLHGIDSADSYPNDGGDFMCKFKPQDVAATLEGCVDLPTGNEKALQIAVATVGPISVAIDADHISFQLYKDGVFYEPSCSQKILDHAVLVVGYGNSTTETTETVLRKQYYGNSTTLDYWLVKNSWGVDWGEKGYIRMSRNRNNNCGIATNASYPTGVKGPKNKKINL